MADVNLELYKMQNWYPALATFCFPTVFLKLKPEEVNALIDRETTGPVVKGLLDRLNPAMRHFTNRFVSVDLAAPTDTARFQDKRGAVHSARSAWNVLISSDKIHESAVAGNVSCLCIRPFRRIDITREYRLFIKGGELKAMSQYWLIRHFGRIEKHKSKYWEIAQKFVAENAWQFPVKDLAMDIYIASTGHLYVLDLNVFGAPTDPLMLNTWERDWSEEIGIQVVPSPHRLTGDVNVSF